jgi:Holliday junction resolvase-like predicted endonuclease
MLLSLIGEQPIPNLLVIRHLQETDNLLVYTSKSDVVKTARRLRNLLSGHNSLHDDLQVDPYNVELIYTALQQKLDGRQDVVINLTGGTKPMSIAAYMIAAQSNFPALYLQSEGNNSRLYGYEFQSGQPLLVFDKVLPEVIGLDEYLSVHIDVLPPHKRPVEDAGHRFEKAVFAALQESVDEIKLGLNIQGAVQIDVVVRCKNQVGIVEVKLGSNKLKAAIDQLNTAGSQTFLGTFTKKFLVSDQDWSKYSDLFDLARAHRIIVIQLPGYAQTGSLNAADIETLTTSIRSGLGAL